MQAIPTKYAGVQFRSRLEARWAAFFDLLEWRWEYEPFDLDGYIPDFIVTPHLVAPFLVEVKPFIEWPCPVPGCMCCAPGKNPPSQDLRDAYDSAVSKIQNSGWTKHALIVGASFPDGSTGRRIGNAVEAVQGSGDWFSTGTVLVACKTCNAKVLKPDVDGFGIYHGCREPRENGSDAVAPHAMWREAGNRVQWRGASSVATHGGPLPPLTERVSPAEIREFFRVLATEE